MERLFLFPVIQRNIKAAGHCNHKLMQVFVRVRTAVRPAGHIVQVIDALDIKGDVIFTLNKGQVTTVIFNFRQLDQTAIAEWHGRPFQYGHMLGDALITEIMRFTRHGVLN